MEEITPLFQYILDQLQDAVILVDESGEILYYNIAAESLTGITMTDAIGTSCRNVFGRENDQAYCVFEDFGKTEEQRSGYRSAIQHTAGHSIPVDICMVRIPSEYTGRNLLLGMIRDISVLETLHEQDTETDRFGKILARSSAMKRIFDLIQTISDTDVSVLIQGESGTGKELVAHAIHNHSLRQDGPFHAVNCGALTLDLLDSELFGHEKGSFTGAIREKQGRVELAEGGTLFLDEVGEMPPALQVKLLRVLQERKFERVGGTKTLTMDARIIAATNVNLQQAVVEGTFRKDLFFRLNVVPIGLPPLRDRKGDVELIAEHYLRKFTAKTNRPARRFSGETMRILMDYPWPGNVRELINAVEYVVAVAPGDLLLPQDLPEQFRIPVKWALDVGGPSVEVQQITPAQGQIYNTNMDEKQRILKALSHHRYRRSEAAAALGMSRTTLWRKMRELGIS